MLCHGLLAIERYTWRYKQKFKEEARKRRSLRKRICYGIKEERKNGA